MSDYTPHITHERRSGNTTRQVDFAIQQLFTTGEVFWWDHYNRSGNMAQEHGWGILLRRLFSEHHLTGSHGLDINKKKWTIKLKS